MGIQIKDIINKVFTTVNGGYDMDEVDGFLDMLADALDLKEDALAVERRRSLALTSELQRLDGVITQYKEANRAECDELLSQAHHQAEGIVQDASAQGKTIVIKAQAEAERILAKAEAQAELTVNEASDQARLIVANAAEEAKKLEKGADAQARKIIEEANAQGQLIVSKCIEEADAIMERASQPSQEEEEDGEYPSTQWLNDPEARYDAK